MDPLSTKFAALADPTRRAILARLALGEASVGELAQPFAMSGPAVTKHLKVLEHAGLVTRGRAAQWRPCKIEPAALKEVDDEHAGLVTRGRAAQWRPCKIEPAALKEVDDWLEEYRRFWNAGLDRLEEYLGELQAKEQQEVSSKRRKTAKRKSPQRVPSKK